MRYDRNVLSPNEFAPSTARRGVGLAAVLQPDRFDVCCPRRYAQTSAKSYCLAVTVEQFSRLAWAAGNESCGLARPSIFTPPTARLID
jgi:hypothetical protein